MPESNTTLPDAKGRSSRAKRSTADGPTMRSFAEQKRKFRPGPKGWLSWWPVAVGVALGCIAPQLRDLLRSCEPWGMRAVFPFVLVAGRQEIGMSEELTRTLPQLMLFLQFPLEGLLTKITLSRGVKVLGATGQLIFLHAVAALVLWLISGVPQ